MKSALGIVLSLGMTLVGCSDSLPSIPDVLSADGPGPQADGQVVTPDGNTVTPDAGVDSTAADTSVDSTAADTSVDSTAADTSVDSTAADTSVDSTAADTSVDSTAADTSVDTTSPDSTVDTTMPPDGATIRMVDCDTNNNNPANSQDVVVQVQIFLDTTSGQWSAPAACEWECSANYCEFNNQCLSTRQVNCDTSNANPANSADVVAQVAITCNANGSWSSPAACAWDCNANYCEFNGQCLTTRNVNCDTSNGNPANSTDVVATVALSCDTDGNWSSPAACDWDCNTSYCEFNDQCLTTRNVNCDTSNGNPANSTDVVVQVPLTCESSGNWSNPTTCDWDCNTSYCEYSGQCLTTRNVNCDTNNSNPANSHDVIAQVPITCGSGDTWGSPAACAWDCNTSYCEYSGQCLTTRTVSCDESTTPANATSNVVDVDIACQGDGSFASPAECAWYCDTGYCPDADQCRAFYSDQNFDTATSIAGKWFGGDSRNPGYRNVGVGQSITMATDFAMTEFAFYFTGGFPAGTVLVLNVRNASGTVLQTVTHAVPTTYTGGFFYWPVTRQLDAGASYIFTAYMQDGLLSTYNTGVRADGDAGFAAGEGYSGTINDASEDFDDWSPWSPHPWDFYTSIRGLAGASPVKDFIDPDSIANECNRWFGGYATSDNNAGGGQSVTLAGDTVLRSFGLHFAGSFGNTSEETVVLQIRNQAGQILREVEAPLSTAFSGGWFIWDVDNFPVCGGEEYVYTAYVRGAENNAVHSYMEGDCDANYAGGQGYYGGINSTSGDFADWSRWNVHSWDFYYYTEGSRQP